MKLNMLIASGLLLLLAACGQSYDEYDQGYEQGYDGYNQQGGNIDNFNAEPTNFKQVSSNRGDGEIMMQQVKNPKTGMVMEIVPLPSHWKMTEMAWLGPDESRIEFRQGGMFTEYQRRLTSVDQVIQEDILPKLRNMGMQVNNIIEIPEVARNDQQNYALYWKYAPSRDTHQAKGIEVTDPKSGGKGIIIVHFLYSQSQLGSLAAYQSHVLTAKSHRYEQDKKALIFALANKRLNPQAVAAHNRKEQQRAQVSDAAFQRRMAEKQRNFDAMQRTNRTLSEIGDIYHEGYMNRSKIQDRMHDNTVNGIWERETMTNPYSNQPTTVESGYKHYYMNQFGEYIGTNDEFYNPANDPNLNNMEWKRINRPNNRY